MAIADSIATTRWVRGAKRSVVNTYACQIMPRHSGYYAVRDVFERLLGVLLLIIAAPLIAVLALAARLSSRGTGIYRQTRVGLGGRVFTMYKLRSMRCDAESRTGPVWASAGVDPRVTPLGYWLRHLHLDELPQLYNIVCGEMSLVGPRPERPEFVALLADQIPGYLERLTVKPGITGLAQINLPPDTDLNSVRCKLVLDREYIESAGPLLDLRIALCTLLRLVGFRGGRAVSLLGLQRVVEWNEPLPSNAIAPPVANDTFSEPACDVCRELQSQDAAVPLFVGRS